MNVMVQQLLQKITPTAPYAAHAREIIETASSIADRVGEEKARIAKNANLSDAGKRAELTGLVNNKFLKALVEASRPYRRAAKHISEQRAKLTLPKPDKSDLIGEVKRQEYRTYLRGLPAGERTVAALKLAESDDGALAILDVPPVLTGLTDHMASEIRSMIEKRLYGPQIEVLDQMAEDYAAVGGAVQMAEMELQKASGDSPDAFAKKLTNLKAEIDR